MRLIDADALHAKILEENRRNYAATENVAQILLRIETAPTIEPEVRHGRWIEVKKHRDENGTIQTDYECSECFAMLKDSYPEEIEDERFSYNCGAEGGMYHSAIEAAEAWNQRWKEVSENADDN